MHWSFFHPFLRERGGGFLVLGNDLIFFFPFIHDDTRYPVSSETAVLSSISY